MTATEKKKLLRKRYLKPKIRLRKERKKAEYTTEYMANVIGLQRRQYEKKGLGEYPFNDYEMQIVSKKLNKTIEELFFDE